VTPAATLNPRIDAYIAKSKPFAQPILTHIRNLVHKACPEVEEAMKWSMPFFTLSGIVIGHMAAFKEHCSVSFWGPEMNAILNEAGLHSEDGMGSLGKITSLKDLPPDKKLLGYYRQAAELIVGIDDVDALVQIGRGDAICDLHDPVDRRERTPCQGVTTNESATERHGTGSHEDRD